MIILAFPWALSLLSCPCWRTPDQTEVPWRKGKYPAWGNENTGFRALGCKCLSWPSHASRDTQFHRYIYIYMCVCTHVCTFHLKCVCFQNLTLECLKTGCQQGWTFCSQQQQPALAAQLSCLFQAVLPEGTHFWEAADKSAHTLNSRAKQFQIWWAYCIYE